MARRALASLLLAVGLFAIPALAAAFTVRVGDPAPEITGDRWINSAPLSMAGLRGRVVLVEFWTFG
ncbi:MAG TPA: hypothetical protein VL948_09795 [Verrucomicrobiae bacterium]|jgi:hypothetical protein|nr:hypothetical protein [Verrucomicrobiae bacterium]